MKDTTPLTEQEYQVFRYIAEGLTPAETGELLLMPENTVFLHLFNVREAFGAKTNEHAVLIAAFHYQKLLAGAVAKHGTPKAIDWHEENGIPLCAQCSKAESAPVTVRPHAPYRRLSAPEDRVVPGQVVRCGTIQKARMHINQGERIGDLVCGCREAYVEWWRQYRRDRAASATAAV